MNTTKFNSPAALNPSETGRYLGGVTTKTLANWRASGKGPAFIRYGEVGSRVAYLVSDLDAFMKKCRVGSKAVSR